MGLIINLALDTKIVGFFFYGMHLCDLQMLCHHLGC
jgi:hypothetical protein